MSADIEIRPFRPGEEAAVSQMICDTLRISNIKDYTEEDIEENVKGNSPEAIAEKAENSHFYVACAGGKVVGCGCIMGYHGRCDESYIATVFVLPDYQGMGLGRRIVETLERDEYFTGARRTVLSASITALSFYRKLGYEFKNGVTELNEYKGYYLEKKR